MERNEMSARNSRDNVLRRGESEPETITVIIEFKLIPRGKYGASYVVLRIRSETRKRERERGPAAGPVCDHSEQRGAVEANFNSTRRQRIVSFRSFTIDSFGSRFVPPRARRYLRANVSFIASSAQTRSSSERASALDLIRKQETPSLFISVSSASAKAWKPRERRGRRD